MVQVDLITGFLGAGKTTFLRRYVAYLTAQGHHVCILENDFGAVNVDAMLVQDLLGERCEIETISVYVKPEENAAYYAVNGAGSEEYRIQL